MTPKTATAPSMPTRSRRRAKFCLSTVDRAQIGIRSSGRGAWANPRLAPGDTFLTTGPQRRPPMADCAITSGGCRDRRRNAK